MSKLELQQQLKGRIKELYAEDTAEYGGIAMGLRTLGEDDLQELMGLKEHALKGALRQLLPETLAGVQFCRHQNASTA